MAKRRHSSAAQAPPAAVKAELAFKAGPAQPGSTEIPVLMAAPNKSQGPKPHKKDMMTDLKTKGPVATLVSKTTSAEDVNKNVMVAKTSAAKQKSNTSTTSSAQRTMVTHSMALKERNKLPSEGSRPLPNPSLPPNILTERRQLDEAQEDPMESDHQNSGTSGDDIFRLAAASTIPLPPRLSSDSITPFCYFMSWTEFVASTPSARATMEN